MAYCSLEEAWGSDFQRNNELNRNYYESVHSEENEKKNNALKHKSILFHITYLYPTTPNVTF